MKCFYVYYDEPETCFDCGRKDRVVVGYYMGEPNKERMTEIARKFFNGFPSEWFDGHVQVFEKSILETGNYAFHNGKKRIFWAEPFNLEEIK